MSLDGRWWFDGIRWQPSALSPAWRPQRRDIKPWPAWLMSAAGAWLIALTLWEPVLLAMAATGHPDGRLLLTTAVGLFSIGGVATMAWGFTLAKQRRWREVAISVAAGTVAVLAWYWGVMLVDDVSGNSSADHAAAAGTVIFSIPIAVGVTILLGIGVGAHAALSALRRAQDRAARA